MAKVIRVMLRMKSRIHVDSIMCKRGWNLEKAMVCCMPATKRKNCGNAGQRSQGLNHSHCEVEYSIVVSEGLSFSGLSDYYILSLWCTKILHIQFSNVKCNGGL